MQLKVKASSQELLLFKNIATSKQWNDIFDRPNISYSLAYHFSPIRKNIISWFDFSGKKVLELGAQCGALTFYLQSVASEVVAIESDENFLEVNKLRNSSSENLAFINSIDEYTGDKFDVIVLIDMITTKVDLEYVKKISSKYLKESGKIILSAYNRMGLRFISGAEEMVYKEPYIGIEGYTEVEQTSFSKKELEKLLKSTGYTSFQIYYPFPDHRFCESIFSDDYLPKIEDLRNKETVELSDRFSYFNETKVLHSFVNEGLFSSVSDSFLFVIDNISDN